MKSEIEFRCWYYNQMHKVDDIDFRHRHIDLFAADSIKFEDGILMQYTGLKDKNGKKIFEGDIIRLDDDYRKLISSGNAKTEEDLVRKDCLVGFKDGSFMFCRNRYVLDDFDSYLWLSNEHCEVIGNIYENNLESEMN